MIFMHPEGYNDYCDEDQTTLCIRAYTHEQKLSLITKPNDVIYETNQLKFDVFEDYPSDDFPPGVSEYLIEKYSDESQPNPYKCHMESKISGWPSWIQSSQLSEEYEFILQIDDYGKPYWDWGDCPMLYIFRHIKTGKFCGEVQMF